MTNFNYDYPKEIELDDGQRITLSQDDMKNERYLAIVIPSNFVEKLVSNLENNGFSDAVPSWNQGEKYGLSKVMNNTWELHMRIFANGHIFPHIEVRRDYFEHLDENYIWPVYDEAVNLVSGVTDAIATLHIKTNQWVRRIVTKAQVTLSPPSNLTEWKPVAYFGAGVAAGALLTVGILKLIEYWDTNKKRKELE